VFLPLTLLTGVTGVFFRSLALTMSVALLTSLVLALTFTPVLAERFVRIKRRKAGKGVAYASRDQESLANEREETEEHQGRILGAIVRRYEWLLGHALDNRWLVLIVVGAV